MTKDFLDIDFPIADIMTTEVICVHVGDTVDAVRAIMLREDISGAPVVDHFGRLCGVVSKTDLLRDAWLLADRRVDVELSPAERMRLGPGFHMAQTAPATVGEVMTPFAVSLPPEASVVRAAALMVYQGVRRLIVADEDGFICGVVSLRDIARWTARRAGFLVPPPRESSAQAA